MAVEKFNFLDESGVQKLSEFLLRSVNSRIAERIVASITGADMTAENKVLSSAAIAGLIGSLADYDANGTMTGTENTVLGKIKALQLAIGEDIDTADDETVYGRIAEVEALVSSLTHLTYKTVTGPITQENATAKKDIIYLQQDAESLAVNNAGFLADENGENAVVGETGSQYGGWVDGDQIKKATVADGVFTKTEEVLASNDDLLAVGGPVARVTDNTWNLYIAQDITWTNGGAEPANDEDTIASVKWLCVGDTSLELSNYWSKTDKDTKALRDAIMVNIDDATIEAKVKAAYLATDPFTGGDNAVIPTSWV